MTLNKPTILTLIAVALTFGATGYAIGFIVAQPLCDWLSSIGALTVFVGLFILMAILFRAWFRLRN